MKVVVVVVVEVRWLLPSVHTESAMFVPILTIHTSSPPPNHASIALLLYKPSSILL